MIMNIPTCKTSLITGTKIRRGVLRLAVLAPAMVAVALTPIWTHADDFSTHS
jgi:hypothetical protein